MFWSLSNQDFLNTSQFLATIPMFLSVLVYPSDQIGNAVQMEEFGNIDWCSTFTRKRMFNIDMDAHCGRAEAYQRTGGVVRSCCLPACLPACQLHSALSRIYSANVCMGWAR
jgi:hypothetical protein